MEQGTFDLGDAASPAPVKLCDCGCRQPAPIAPYSNKRRGYVKGQPMRFVNGHTSKGIQPALQVGQCFGQGVVIDANLRIPRKGKPRKTLRAARLVCGCGTEYVSPALDLQYGKVVSCGCHKARGSRFVDRTGQRFGKLVVVQYAGPPGQGKTGRSALWLCECDCGTEKVANSGSLVSGSVVSCGCSRRQPRKGIPLGSVARRAVLNGYRGAARRRDLAWELTDQDFDRLTSRDCFYCGLPPSTVRKPNGQYEGGEFVYNGIDRMDSALGYTPGNVVSCCEICNRAKMDRPYDEFIAWIARLTEYHWFHPDVMPSCLLRGGA